LKSKMSDDKDGKGKNNSKVVILSGVPGVGKSTVANKALDDDSVSCDIVNYGDVMLEIAKDEDLIETRDEIRKLNASVQKELQKSAGEKISNLSEEGSVLVDTHSTISTPEGYLPGIPEWVLRPLSPDTFVLVEASPYEISSRRSKDEDVRERDKEAEEDLREHQLMNRTAAMSCAVLSGATVKIIKNPDGGLDKASEELKKVLT